MNTTATSKKIVVITGEKSGEMHAAKMCVELFRMDPALKIIGWGGDDMKKAGVDVKRDISTLAIMGFLEVLKNASFLRKIFTECKAMIVAFQPDMIIFVDYSGFNLRMAKWTHNKGYNNVYYIPPKTWAWNQKRTHKLRKFVRKVYAILPFEKSFFESYGVDVTYVGNPVVDTIRDFRFNEAFTGQLSGEKPIVALVPGSRRSELVSILPAMAGIVASFPEFQFVVCGVTGLDDALYETATAKNIPVVFDRFYDVLHGAAYAVVTSGTATLETAVMGVPQIVCFKTSYVSYAIAKQLIKVPFISLVNLIAQKEVVRELIQEEVNPQTIARTFLDLQKNRERIVGDYDEIRRKLGTTNASLNVAEEIMGEIKRIHL